MADLRRQYSNYSALRYSPGRKRPINCGHSRAIFPPRFLARGLKESRRGAREEEEEARLSTGCDRATICKARRGVADAIIDSSSAAFSSSPTSVFHSPFHLPSRASPLDLFDLRYSPSMARVSAEKRQTKALAKVSPRFAVSYPTFTPKEIMPYPCVYLESPRGPDSSFELPSLRFEIRTKENAKR